MATETVTATEPIEADLPIEQFVQRGNDRDAGKDVPELTPPPVVEEAGDDEADVNDTPPQEAATTDTKKVDGRTREGRKSKIQQEIEEATARKYAAKAEADAEEARLAKIRRDRETVEAPRRPAEDRVPETVARSGYDGTDQRDPEPVLDAYKDKADPYTEWMRDVTRWDARREHRKLTFESQQRAAIESTNRTWDTRLADARKSDPDIDRKINSQDTPIDMRIIGYVKNHDMGPQIAAYLHDHKDFAQGLLTLHPVEQIGRIGEIVGTLKSRAQADRPTSPATPAPISSAKQPPKLVGSSPVVSPAEDDDEENLPMDDFIRRGNKKDPRFASSRRA